MHLPKLPQMTMEKRWLFSLFCLFLVPSVAGQPEAVVAEREVVHALPGADVNLVCSFPKRHTPNILQTQWSKISDTQRTGIAVYHPLDGTHYLTFPEASYNFSVSFSTRKCCSRDVTEALCSPDPNATPECSQWALHLKNVTVSLSGQYECRFITLPDGEKASKIQLIVKAEGQPEAVVAERKVVHALPGADVNLVCSFPKRYTTFITQTQWSKISDTQSTAIAVYHPRYGTHYLNFPEASYNFSASFSTRKCCSWDVTEALCSPDPNATSECSQWALHLKNVTVSLSGQYECCFTAFPDGPKASKIQLIVKAEGQPEAVMAEREVVHALPGADLNLVCSFPKQHTTSIAQTQWSKISDTQRTGIAVYHPLDGTHHLTFPEASYNFSMSFSTRKCCSRDVTEALCSPDADATSECSQWALHLKNVTVSLSGQYERSFATYPDGEKASKIQLIVKAEGQPEAVVAEREVVHALPGADVNLVCSFTKRHTTSITLTQWSKISDTQRTAIAVYHPLNGSHCFTFPEASYNFSASFSTRKCCSWDVTEALCSPDPNAMSECSQWALHLKNVTVSLSGQYECSFTAFPGGEKASKIQLIVKAEGGARDTKASRFLWPTVVAVLLLFCSFLIA